MAQEKDKSNVTKKRNTTPRKYTKSDNKESKSTSKKSTKKTQTEIVDNVTNDNLNKESKPVEVNKDNLKKNGLFELIVTIVLAILLLLLVGYFVGRESNFKDDNYLTANKEIQKFIEEYNYILENYYGDIDKDELILSAIKGMLSSLDEYSQFIDTTSNNTDITLEGEYVGVGIGVVNDAVGNIIISQIYPNSPALEAGIQVNDVIVKFNDESLKNTTTTELVEKIDKVDNMKLTILRDEEEIEFELEKSKIILQSVEYEMKDNNIGYIKVDIFAKNTNQQFAEALKKLENQGLNGLIIDLRNNSGGHLSSVKDMISLFLDSNHVIYQIEDKDSVEKVYSSGNKDAEYQIVILQNLNSASASEVMASALHEQLGAYIIGNTSYGKGTVQRLQTVSDIGQYKLTVEKWLTSNGDWIYGVGIKPDLELSLSDDYKKDPILANDNQYQAAIDYLTK